jgi:hypothetical protein
VLQCEDDTDEDSDPWGDDDSSYYTESDAEASGDEIQEIHEVSSDEDDGPPPARRPVVSHQNYVVLFSCVWEGCIYFKGVMQTHKMIISSGNLSAQVAISYESALCAQAATSAAAPAPRLAPPASVDYQARTVEVGGKQVVEITLD